MNLHRKVKQKHQNKQYNYIIIQYLCSLTMLEEENLKIFKKLTSIVNATTTNKLVLSSNLIIYRVQ
jgi:hypothetical protein